MSTAELPVEAARNRLLRLLDWRLLLPDIAPGRVMCVDSDELAEALQLVAMEVLDRDTAGVRSCDLGVAVEPSSRNLRDVCAALRDDGALYVEWHAPSVALSVLRQRLQSGGFEHVVFYTRVPARGRTEQWVPLESSKALRFTLEQRPGARSRARHIVRTLGDLTGCAIASLRGGRPVSAIATRGGSERASALEAVVRRHWSVSEFGAPPRQLSTALLTGGMKSINKVVALVFADGSRTPRLAVKMPRVAESTPALIREAETLEQLQRRPVPMRSVPKVYFREEEGGVLMVGQSVVTGRRLSSTLAPRTASRLALQATAWQVELAGHPSIPDRHEWWPRLIAPVLADFERSYGPVVDSAMLREAMNAVAGLRTLPLVCEQRDFAPWNLLLSPEGELAVLDWESSEPLGLPGADLTYLLSYVSIYLEQAHASGRYAEAYRAMLDPGSQMGDIAKECFRVYGAATGLGADDLHAVRLFTWMLHSRSGYRQLSAEVGGAPPPERLRGSLFLRLWEAEVRHGAGSGS